MRQALVERIDDGSTGQAVLRADHVGDPVERRLGAPGEEDLGPFAGKRTRHGTADRTTRAVGTPPRPAITVRLPSMATHRDQGPLQGRVSARAEALVQEFAAANDELIALLQQASPEQWRMHTADEGELRPVGVIAHHVAVAHARIAQRVEAFAHARPVPARHPELFDERNAQHARANPDPDQGATLDLLRANGAAVAALIAGLSDVELERAASEDPGAPVMTTAEVIELRQIGHVRSHLATIKTVLGRPPTSSEP